MRRKLGVYRHRRGSLSDRWLRHEFRKRKRPRRGLYLPPWALSRGEPRIGLSRGRGTLWAGIVTHQGVPRNGICDVHTKADSASARPAFEGLHRRPFQSVTSRISSSSTTVTPNVSATTF